MTCSAHSGFTAASALAATIAATASGQCPRYELTAIIEGPECGLGTAQLEGLGINDHGHVVGTMTCLLGQRHAFVWYGAGPIQIIPMPPGEFSSRAEDINNDGLVVGCMAVPDTYAGHVAFLYDGIETKAIAVQEDTAQGHASAINNDGCVVGGHAPMGGQWNAMRWCDGSMEILPGIDAEYSLATGINDRGQIIGDLTNLIDPLTGFLWDEGRTIELGPMPGGSTSRANGVNNDAVIAVAGESRALRWQAGEWTELPIPEPFTRAGAGAIADTGEVFGAVTDPGRAGAIWFDGQAFAIDDLIADETPLAIRSAGAVNAAGQVTGYGRITTGAEIVSFVLTPIEPLAGDIACNARVDFIDLLTLLTSWGGCLDCRADLDGNGVVDHDDLSVLLANWS